MSTPDRRGMLDRADMALSIRRQCMLLGIARSGVYRPPRPANDNDLALMQRLDELFTAWPFLGSRRMTAMLKAEGLQVNRKRVQRGHRGAGTEAEHDEAGAGPEDLSLPAAQHDDRPAEPGVGGRHYLSARRPRLSLSRRHHRLGEPCGSGVAPVEHDGRLVLRGGPGRGASEVRHAGDLQYRPGQPVHQRGLHRRAGGRKDQDLHGWPRSLDGQRLHRAAVAVAQA
ncbi:hypothetical protein CV770_41195 [Bradyrhizobium sp. AC87j1]|nr:hypothetical protein CV770_41195 [Bradyrhizobium sp. AC87j1]